MTTVMAMTFTVNSLLSRPKLDYDGGYDAAVKGPSVVVYIPPYKLKCESLLLHG